MLLVPRDGPADRGSRFGVWNGELGPWRRVEGCHRVTRWHQTLSADGVDDGIGVVDSLSAALSETIRAAARRWRERIRPAFLSVTCWSDCLLVAPPWCAWRLALGLRASVVGTASKEAASSRRLFLSMTTWSIHPLVSTPPLTGRLAVTAIARGGTDVFREVARRHKISARRCRCSHALSQIISHGAVSGASRASRSAANLTSRDVACGCELLPRQSELWTHTAGSRVVVNSAGLLHGAFFWSGCLASSISPDEIGDFVLFHVANGVCGVH
jgi:hypothetical protein